MLTFGSACSGIEAASVAWGPLGFEALWLSEVDKAASRVLAAHYPDVPNMGDMTRLADLVDLGIIDAPDILIGGTPCFPAGTFVTTPEGLRPIETILPGDNVLTHKGRYRKVVRTGSKESDTVVLKGQGHPGLTTTREHPFLVRERRGRTTRIKGKSVRLSWVTDPTWERAENLVGKHWSSVSVFPNAEIPQIDSAGNERAIGPVSEHLMWLAGAYLGDGWPRISHRRGCVTFGVNAEKCDRIVAAARRAGLHASAYEVQTGVKVEIASRPLARWLNQHFGRGSSTKRLPGWLWGSPVEMRQAFLDGYAATDGTVIKGGTRWATTSWELAIGIRMLLNSLGRPATISRVTPRKGGCVIQGREVNERPYWTVGATFSDRSSFEMEGLRFGRVRSLSSGLKTTVFNLEVEEDNSYCADGLVVHNCQDFSVAGLRAGLDGDRGKLILSYMDLANAIDRARAREGKPPCIILFENVPGLLSHKENPFGNFLAAVVGEDVALEPPGGRWTNAGCVLGPQRAAAWRILDSQYFGLAQRRRRVFLVASAREGFDPAQLLFEFDGVRRDSAPSREAGEGIAGTLDARTDGGGFPGSDGAMGGMSSPSFVSPQTSPHGGGNNQSGPIDVATARNAHGGPHGRLDFESETFILRQARAVALRGREGGAVAEMGGEQANALRASAGGGSDPYVLAPVHAFAFKASHFTRGKDGRPSDISPPLTADADKGDQDPLVLVPLAAAHPPAIAHAEMAVRRLMPVECERLQGFPLVWKSLIITVCFDPQKDFAAVEMSCRKWLANAWPVDDEPWLQPVEPAGPSLSTNPAALAQLVAVLAPSFFETEEAAILSPENWRSLASGVDANGRFRQPMPAGAIARGLAPILRGLVNAVPSGEEGSLPSTRLSIPVATGGPSVQKSGLASEAVVSAALRDQRSATFTTSDLGQLFQKDASTLATSLCSVLTAIAGFIPEQTLSENFALNLIWADEYTGIKTNGKPVADGPRYKQLGNSMSTTVIQWLGRRINRFYNIDAEILSLLG